jgi:HK97 gp10 family phage protein
VRVTLEGFEEAADALLSALDEEMPRAMDEVSRSIAEEAAAHHAYTNRTGLLQSRTVPGATRGRFSQDSLSGEALGDTPYGGYVEEGTRRMAARPFLAPAAEHKEAESARALEAGLQLAADRAGW